MCVTRHSRQPPSVRVDIFVNTSAIYGALHFIWHLVLQCCTPSINIFYSWSHIYIVIIINVSNLRSRLVFQWVLLLGIFPDVVIKLPSSFTPLLSFCFLHLCWSTVAMYNTPGCCCCSIHCSRSQHEHQHISSAGKSSWTCETLSYWLTASQD